MNQKLSSETIDFAYNSLYRLGGIAAWIAALLTVSEVIVFILFPQPGTISDWFMLFQNNRVIGLLDFWGLEIPMYIAFVFVFLAAYFVLRKTNESYMAVATILVVLGVGIFLATNNPFSMLSLSNQFVTARIDAQRTALLSAGQAMLTNTNQRAVGGFNMGLFLVSIAGLIVSAVMLHSHTFNKLTAYIGIVAHGLSLADYLRQALTSSPILALLLILPNALFLVTWYILVGRRLCQLGRLEMKMVS